VAIQPPRTFWTAPSTSSTFSSSSSWVRLTSTSASSAGVEIGSAPSWPMTRFARSGSGIDAVAK